MHAVPKPHLKLSPLFQIAPLLLISAVTLLWHKILAASLLVGGLLQIVPQVWFAHRALKFVGTRRTPEVVHAIYRGQIGKAVLTAMLFSIVFMTCKQWNYPALFAAFILMISLQSVLNSKMLKQ